MIHYHGLPITPVGDMLRALRGRHAMVSFAHPEQLEAAVEVCQSVVLDNGAFSAYQSAKSYDFKGYRSWCDEWIHHPAVDWCVIPDVIDGGEVENDKLLSAWYLPNHCSVPVYHFDEPLLRLACLMDHYPRIALGSSGKFMQVGTRAWWMRTAEIMKVVCDENGVPKVKLHGMRMLDPKVFGKMPLASADSCNVGINKGLDNSWIGAKAPKSPWVKALVLVDRIENSPAASRWATHSIDPSLNLFPPTA